MGKKIKELVLYSFWGVITTSINLILYYLFIKLKMNYLISNVSSYGIAVILSYYFNVKFVFNRGEKKKVQKDMKKMGKYFLVRLFSIIVDSALLYLLVDKLKIGVIISKGIDSIIIILLTFIANKIFVFKEVNENYDRKIEAESHDFNEIFK